MCDHAAQRCPPSVNTNKPYIKILEQPASKVGRFRYECEIHNASTILGASSTPFAKKFPSIQICGYTGKAVVIVSCVTSGPPFRPHPHSVVRKGGSTNRGVHTQQVSGVNPIVQFCDLGIQCVKRTDAEVALRIRQEVNVDPFKTGFHHISNVAAIDFSSIRLCFQAFLLDGQEKYSIPLRPVVSNVITDKKASGSLCIVELSDCVCPADGGSKNIILLCDKLKKSDVCVRFYEEQNGVVVWEGFSEYTRVHYQTAISFRPPKYHNEDITEPVQVYLQLFQKNDLVSSTALPFQYLPLNSGLNKRKRKMLDTSCFGLLNENDLFSPIYNITSETNNNYNTVDEVEKHENIFLNNPFDDHIPGPSGLNVIHN